MNTMTISPSQNQYVTKAEFKELEIKLDELDSYSRDGFKTIIRYCDSIDKGLLSLESKVIQLGVKIDMQKNEIIKAINDK